MSGPIVRKYGFPNFDKIFGKRELEHGFQLLQRSFLRCSCELKGEVP